MGVGWGHTNSSQSMILRFTAWSLVFLAKQMHEHEIKLTFGMVEAEWWVCRYYSHMSRTLCSGNFRVIADFFFFSWLRRIVSQRERQIVSPGKQQSTTLTKPSFPCVLETRSFLSVKCQGKYISNWSKIPSNIYFRSIPSCFSSHFLSPQIGQWSEKAHIFSVLLHWLLLYIYPSFKA